jgi:hypothetical protein
MKTHGIADKDGRIGAFEVANFGRHRACRFVSKIPGVSIVKRQKHFQFIADDEFCEFELNGERFFILEPFGDNNAFLIGHNPKGRCSEMDEIIKAFASYKTFCFF